MISSRMGRPLISGTASLVLVLFLFTMLAACGEPDPTLSQNQGQGSSGPEGEILFVADHNIMRWDDGDIEQVTRDVFAASPSWAAAGDRFVYVQVGEAFSDLVIARRDGVSLLKVTEDHEPVSEPFTQEYVLQAAWAWDVDWSPAGEQLIYVSDKGLFDEFSRPLFLWFSETFEVGPYLLPAAADIGVTQEDPSFSQDGDRVVFVVRNETGDGTRVPEIWTIDLNTATYEQFIITDEGAYDPDWAPDSQNIAYIQRTGQSNDVWIAPMNGADRYQITNIGTTVSPVWSPDGRFIAFFRENQGSFEAWYVELSPGENGQLTASEPQLLFTNADIDTVSGMSWIQR
ncbi:MAG: PD40 domain-containing protein [Chloroflexia bacterium]|nr:PD40 domain-containing protein [Chloroflexia bacterium]